MNSQLDLFERPVENINIANKIESFYSGDVQRKRGWQKELVFKAIKKLGSACDREISALTKLPLSVVPDRRGTLLEEGKIEISRTGIDRQTGKKVTYYKILNNQNN